MKPNASIAKICFAPLLVAATAFIVCFSSTGVGELLHNLSTPRSGETEVLPPEALFVLDFTRQTGVKSVSFSPRLADNRFLAQPITESIYPAVVQGKGGDVYLCDPVDPLPAGCVVLRERKGLIIANCR